MFAAVLLGVVLTLPFLPFAREAYRPEILTLEITQVTGGAGQAQLFYDVGRGFNQRDSSSASIAGSGLPERIQLTFPAKDCRTLRYDPINLHCDITIASAEIRYADGTLALRLTPADFAAGNDIAELKTSGDALHLRLTKEGFDPSVLLAAKLPASLPFHLIRLGRNVAAALGPVLMIMLAALGIARFVAIPSISTRFRRLRDWLIDRPSRAIALVALGAVTASTYPIVFLGQSFVSPNHGISLLYETSPSLPGVVDRRIENAMGSDIGALMWSSLPSTAVQFEAVSEHHELPLWNRYNSAGVTLLGQGQSMFGDPLHLLPLLSNSAAWAWDVKFLVAKWLFALGMGMCAFAAARHLPAALLISLASPFIGFFVFRINHPAFFSVCYAPWVLYCWLRFTEAGNPRARLGWLGGLVLANWCLLTSGTVKEAYMILLGLNGTGVLALLAASSDWREKLGRLTQAFGAGVVLVLVSAPLWLVFLEALLKAHTNYDRPQAYQFQPGLLLGLFDEAFYRPLSDQLLTFRPGLNFIFLGGFACFLARLRVHFANRTVMAIAAAALPPLALVYGVIPPSWIVTIPFIGNVTHIDNTFICVLIVQLGVLAAAGFRVVAQRIGKAEGRQDLITAALIVLVPVGLYLGFVQAVHRNSLGPGLLLMPADPDWGGPVPPFVWGYLWSLLAALALGALTIRRAAIRKHWSTGSALVLATCLAVLLWRQGMHGPSGFDEYVVNPTVRADLHAPSVAVDFVQQAQPLGPHRVVGLGDNLFAGWNCMDRLEAVGGPDPLVNRHYRELLKATNLLPGGSNWHPHVTPANLPPLLRYLDALNVRYYLQLPSLPGPALALVKAADLNVYESSTVWPRAFLRIISWSTKPRPILPG